MSVNLNAGQAEATVGMKAPSSPISLEVFGGIFGLPAILCRYCPQYGHRIIFSRKCYYETQCPVPILIHKMKTRAGKAEADLRVVYYPSRLLRARSNSRPSEFDSAPDSHPSSPREYSNTVVRVHPTSLLTSFGALGRAETAGKSLVGITALTAQNFPKILDPHVSPRRPALNFFTKFLRWAWSRSAYNDPSMMMTNFGWRKSR